MGFSTAPTHGKYGALYILRPNGFSGLGLNDLTWGTAATNADSAYYEIVIDHTGTPDSFKWRKNGGAWTEDVAITGAAQTLDEGQTIIFAATTGHTVVDQWVAGNLVAEATTEAGSEAQITDPLMRLINPNVPPTWTDAGGKTVLRVNYTNGTAVFTGALGVTTVAGNLGYIPAAALRKVGYLIDWSLNVGLDMADASRQGQHWKEWLPGQAGTTGGANGYFIAADTLLSALQESIAAGDKYFLLQLFTYDPSQNQTGDHLNAWVTFTSFALGNSINEVIKENVAFTVYGDISMTAAT